MMKTSLKFSERQRGAVLLVGLVMLVMVTLLAISGFNMVKVNQQVAGNMESRGQAMVAANAAIEEAISSTLFLSSPDNLFDDACGSANRKCFDFNDDGEDDVVVVVERPTCIVVAPRSDDEAVGLAEYFKGKADQLRQLEGFNELDDAHPIKVEHNIYMDKYSGYSSCASTHNPTGGPVRSTGGISNCRVVLWDFVAVAQDNLTGARATVRQGVSVWSPKNTVDSVCPLSDEGA